MIGFLLFALAVVLVLSLDFFRGESGREPLRRFAEARLTDVRQSTWFLSQRLRARWGQYPVMLHWQPPPRGRLAEYLTMTIGLAGNALIVTRRGHQLFEKPFFVGGPPLIEPAIPAASAFWIRADEPRLADVLFSDAEAVRLLEQNIVEPADVLELSRRELRIRRATTGLNPRPFAEAEWALATRLIEVLGLSPLV